MIDVMWTVQARAILPNLVLAKQRIETHIPDATIESIGGAERRITFLVNAPDEAIARTLAIERLSAAQVDGIGTVALALQEQ